MLENTQAVATSAAVLALFVAAKPGLGPRRRLVTCPRSIIVAAVLKRGRLLPAGRPLPALPVAEGRWRRDWLSWRSLFFGGVGAAAVALAALRAFPERADRGVELQVLASLRGEREPNGGPSRRGSPSRAGGCGANGDGLCGVFWMFRARGRPAAMDDGDALFQHGVRVPPPDSREPEAGRPLFPAVGAVLRARLRVPGGRAGVEAPQPGAGVAPPGSGSPWSRAARRQHRGSESFTDRVEPRDEDLIRNLDVVGDQKSRAAGTIGTCRESADAWGDTGT